MPGSGNLRVASPVSTGAGGAFFEQHVDALFLVLLLVRAPPPILLDCQVEEVHLQSEHLRWETDDILVIGARADGQRRRLAAQVKRGFTISKTDKTCRETFGDFWADFRGSEFDPANDRLALVTLRGTNVLLQDFNGLLDCARASVDAADFMRRLEVEGFLSKKARVYATVIRQILEDANDTAPSDDEFWRFLAALHLVSFDLNTASAQTEAWIKALLAATANAGAASMAAEASWRELLEVVGAGMPTATSYRYTDLPESLRDRHGPIDTRSTQIIRALSAHSAVTLSGIKTTIGPSTKIPRDDLTDEVLGALSENQIVVISAPAGLGKSAIAKGCVRVLGDNLYCLAFRAEEFAASHIDQTLQHAQIPTNGTELLGILAGQGRKLVLVESVERVLEASVRDAFADLLNLASRDKSLSLLLTCRDYSLETVGSALLGEAGLNFKVVEIPPLTDEELDQVVAARPPLENALKHKDLKPLLRSPYLLDKAAQMDWSGTEAFPTNEREFRRRCWGEVIRRDPAAADGVPLRRERVFEEIALRRARQLRQFVTTEDLDALAIDALRKDGLIVTPPDAGSMAAPGHDVLEDWAIVHWIGQRWILHEKEAQPLVDDIGGYPAIRRAYRRWLSELLQWQTEVTTSFVLSVFQDSTLPAYFRDDTLVCTLQSPFAREFLERHRETLFEDNGRLLVRVIHLMRVACKVAPWWLREAAHLPSQLLVATGEAWPAVLEQVLSGLDQLVPEHTPVVLGLIEDFANSIHWREPEPNGFEQAAKIGFGLLDHLDGYRMDDMRKRALKVIAKVPTGDAKAFEGLVDRAVANERRDQIADNISEILLSGMDGWTTCQYFPDDIIRLTKSNLLLQGDDLGDDDWHRGSSIDIEPSFGIQEHNQLGSFPASSMRGVFLPLLRHHPKQALSFIIELLNHAGRWYGEQLWPYDRLESAFQVTIEVPGETALTQWANPRLWGLYRGITVGPYALQTALMALEAWLQQLCELEEVNLEAWLLKILRESNNVMATAVVASICNTYPDKAGRAALALLSSQELFSLDRARLAQEQGHVALSGIVPNFGIDKLYQDERKKSDAMPHRRDDLEALAVKLQLTDSREDVFALIDRYRAALPPVKEQSEEHRLWRLALHRIDIRGYRPAEMPEGMYEETSNGEESREQRILLVPGKIEADIQDVIDQHTPIAEQQEREFSLLNWGQAAWDGQDQSHLDIRDWEEFLARARSRDAEPEPEDFMRGGPGIIAAVCVRDHWDEMGAEDRDWCVEKLIREIEREYDSEDSIIRHSKGGHQPDRYAAYVLPSLLGHELSEAQISRMKEAIAKALTHVAEEVSIYSSEGIGMYLTGQMRTFCDGCIAAIAANARLISDRLAEERDKPFQEQLSAAEVQHEVVQTVRTMIVDHNLDPETELGRLNLGDWLGRRAASRILQILAYQGDSDLATRFHCWIATSITADWDAAIEDRGRRRNRDYHFVHEFFERLARFLLKLDADKALRTCEPFVAAVATHPSEVADFIEKLVIEEDRCVEGSSFWNIWQPFADAIYAAPWIDRLDSNHRDGERLVRSIFLKGYWKENLRHWRRLEGQQYRVDDLATQFRGSATAFDAYCLFLHDIGETSLPSAFKILSSSLEAGDPGAMLAQRDTVFLLESLLGRYVFAEPYRLKSDRAVRDAVIKLLDHLVEVGSSAAYRMRDDFVTPLRAAVPAVSPVLKPESEE